MRRNALGARRNPTGLSPTQIRVLTLLAASPDGMPLSAIAESLFVSPPSARRLCQRLVRDGLVTRSAGPGHYILIALSAEGARVLRALNQARVTPIRQLIDALPPPAAGRPRSLSSPSSAARRVTGTTPGELTGAAPGRVTVLSRTTG